jgi:hypothetical protein
MKGKTTNNGLLYQNNPSAFSTLESSALLLFLPQIIVSQKPDDYFIMPSLSNMKPLDENQFWYCLLFLAIFCTISFMAGYIVALVTRRKTIEKLVDKSIEKHAEGFEVLAKTYYQNHLEEQTKKIREQLNNSDNNSLGIRKN